MFMSLLRVLAVALPFIIVAFIYSWLEALMRSTISRIHQETLSHVGDEMLGSLLISTRFWGHREG